MCISEADILDALATVIDPEPGMSVVDLGLVYEIQVERYVIAISKKLTTPACPIASHLVHQVKPTLCSCFPALQALDAQLVWEPQKSPLMISWKAGVQLGWV